MTNLMHKFLINLLQYSICTCFEPYLAHPQEIKLYQTFKAYRLRDAPTDFNIQQLYALPTLYLCVLYLSENKQRLVPLTA